MRKTQRTLQKKKASYKYNQAIYKEAIKHIKVVQPHLKLGKCD